MSAELSELSKLSGDPSYTPYVLQKWSCVLSGLLIACSTASPEVKKELGPVSVFKTIGDPGERSSEPSAAASTKVRAADSLLKLRIATFNIQTFGKTKSKNASIVAKLATIIHDYDVVVIQEVKDISNQAPIRLLDAVNAGHRRYAVLTSRRSGAQPDDRSSQEGYAIYYDTVTVRALPGDHLYDDTVHDSFQREPYLAHMASVRGDFSFVLIDIHTRPDSAVSEIGGLYEVFRWSKQAFPGEGNVIALGDFNAGCRYASTAQLDELAIRGRDFTWIVPDSSDSNVSPNSACAYDRIVATASASAAFTGRWGVHEAFSDAKISDHWPVWAEFAVRTD